MAGPPRRRREVVRSPLFVSQAKQIQPDAARFEEQIRSVEAAVARAAELFAPVPNTPYRVVKTDRFPGAPRLRVFFTIDSEVRATLQWLELMEAGPLTRTSQLCSRSALSRRSSVAKPIRSRRAAARLLTWPASSWRRTLGQRRPRPDARAPVAARAANPCAWR